MEKRFLVEVTVTNMETGEVSTKTDQMDINPLDKQFSNQNFSMLYQDSTRFLSQDLTKLSVLVAWYLVIQMSYENFFWKSQKEIATFFNESASNVSAAIKKLINCGFCTKARMSNGVALMVNPDFAYRGRQRNKAVAIYHKYQSQSQSQSTPLNSEVTSDQFELSTKTKIITYLLAQFALSKVISITVDDIVTATTVSKVTVIKFLKFLEFQHYISRRRGKMELLVSPNDLLKIVQSVN